MNQTQKCDDDPIVSVKDKDINLALKLLRKRVQQAGIFRKVKGRGKTGLYWQIRRENSQRAETRKKGLIR
ncbi:MAG: hypothetical protein U9R43_17105 [Thermodesulfobacteriota bacterium]|nr:hypothetical protein [Thermodesulfobacteriota bacterium]